jgi:type III restriction enzyme
MLTEGWDANTVSHILGIRPFRSQLLCEQVVGRGLRRRSYAVNEQTGRFEPEYAEVYGVPFAFIPGTPPKQQPRDPRPAVEVRAEPDRWDLEIRFPTHDGYRRQLPDAPLHASCDDDACRLHLDQATVALWVENRGVVGAAAEVDLDDIRNARTQRIAYAIAKTLVQREEFFAAHAGVERPWLFPQLVDICRRWLDECVSTDPDVTKGHLLLTQAGARAAEKVFSAIFHLHENRATVLMPIMRRFDPIGSTDGVRFVTRKVVLDPPPEKSHLNHVVLDGVRGNSWPYAKLKRALRADIDEDAWASLNSTESRPFPRPETGKIAVKVINDYGDEVMQVFTV